MLKLTKAELRMVTGRGLVIVFSAKENGYYPVDFLRDGIVQYNNTTYRISSVEQSRNLFHGGVGDMVGLQVTQITYEVSTLFRIAFSSNDYYKNTFTAQVLEMPTLIAEGKTRGEARKLILKMMPAMMLDLGV